MLAMCNPRIMSHKLHTLYWYFTEVFYDLFWQITFCLYLGFASPWTWGRSLGVREWFLFGQRVTYRFHEILQLMDQDPGFIILMELEWQEDLHLRLGDLLAGVSWWPSLAPILPLSFHWVVEVDHTWEIHEVMTMQDRMCRV